jgi:hypothetical protein
MSGEQSQPSLSHVAKRVFLTAARAARDALSADQSGARVPDVVAEVHRYVDGIVQAAVQSGPDDERPACRMGCTACCHLHVVASPPEVIAIAKHIQREFSDTDREALKLRIGSHIAATQGLNAEQRQKCRPACPLLVDDRCSVYPVRPISCRGWNSLDRGLCDADLADPASGTAARLNLAQYVLAGRVAEALAAASHALGLEHRRLDLVRGLQAALADPDQAERAWRSGTTVFKGAVNDEVFPSTPDPEEDRARALLWSQLRP